MTSVLQSENSKNTTLYTLVFVKSPDKKLLLGKNKTSLGKGKWNGYGGKIEKNETIFQSAVRELKEESNLEIDENDLHLLGQIVINDTQNNNFQKRAVAIFTAEKISGGHLKDTREMYPKWFDFERLPYDQMWPDSREWLHLVLENCRFEAEFWYNRRGVLVDKRVVKL